MTVEEKNHKVQEVGAGLVGSVCRRQPELGVWTCRGGGGGGVTDHRRWNSVSGEMASAFT